MSSITLRPLPSRRDYSIGELLYYNTVYAAESFHTNNFVADFIRWKSSCIGKNSKFTFRTTISGTYAVDLLLVYESQYSNS